MGCGYLKKMCLCILSVLSLFLSACQQRNVGYDQVLALRSRLQSCQSCTFQAEVTADYGDEIYTFHLDCRSDASGDLYFTVTEPEAIAGISGVISDSAGNLTFDDQLLAFPMLADGQLTPVSAPWLFLKALRSGYIRSCGQWENGYTAIIDDSYAQDSMQVDIWLSQECVPCAAEILWGGRRILSLSVEDFSCE